jgi:hypothetical protein
MGGYGSGAVGWRPKAEDLKQIDVRFLSREGVLTAGTNATINWQDGTRVFLNVEADSFRLSFQGVNGQVATKIQKTFMPLNYGGERVFCLCPVCDKRAAILYFYGQRFCCAGCCNVTWRSRNKESHDLKRRKAQKIRKKLAVSMAMSEPVISKPKGMHHKTFDRLREELWELEYEVFERIMKKLNI